MNEKVTNFRLHFAFLSSLSQHIISFYYCTKIWDVEVVVLPQVESRVVAKVMEDAVQVVAIV